MENGTVNLLSPPQASTSTSLPLVRVGTNEVFDFSAPDGATVAEKWRRRGASEDYLRLNFSKWSFPFGGESFSNLVVFAGGRVRLSRDAALCPFAANLGIVPEANWTLLDRINRIDRIDSVGEGSQSSVGRDVLGAPQDEIPSLFWHLLTPSNTLALTWQNALLNRETANPVSFQAELFPSGNVVFRYDLARISDEGLLTNVVVGVRGREGLERRQGLEDGDERSRLEVEVENGTVNLLSPPSASTSTFLSRSLSSLSFKTANDLRCDEARAAFDATLGNLDPLAFPPGSTNTVWEHYVYAGTTNGAFALPSSTTSAAVLRVAVSGSGRGELVVGDRAVPLAGQGETPAALNTEETEEGRHGEEGVGVLDRINRIDRIEKTGAVVLSALTNSNPVNPVNPVEKNAVTEFSASPRLSDLRVDAPQATNECLSNLSPPQASTSTSLILPVPRGQTTPLYLRADATLAVSFSSDDFAFGSLPDLAASRLVGRINFPNVTATTPCFHDYVARQKEVTLPVGADADANKFGLWRF